MKGKKLPYFFLLKLIEYIKDINKLINENYKKTSEQKTKLKKNDLLVYLKSLKHVDKEVFDKIKPTNWREKKLQNRRTKKKGGFKRNKTRKKKY